MTLLSRAEFLRLTAGAFVAQSVLPAQDPRAERVARLIREYDAQGFHRTATGVDSESAMWLSLTTRAAGAEVELETFPVQHVDIRSACIEADGRRVDGVPFFDGAFTAAGGISGQLSTDIAFITIDAAGISSEGQSLETLRRSNAHRGIVAVTNGAHPGLSLSNAASFSSPYGVPVLQVSSDEHRWLAQLAAARREIHFVVDATRTASHSINVVANVRGANSALYPLVLMTPRSGWWHCASERGGGIACWVEAIRAVAAAKPARSLIAIASSGHELGHFGLEAFLQTRAFVMNRTSWIHLGANIGAAQGPGNTLQTSDDEMETMMAEAMTRAGLRIDRRHPRGAVARGEAENVHRGGGRYISIIGNNKLFHNTGDRGADAVDLHVIERFANAFATVTTLLASA